MYFPLISQAWLTASEAQIDCEELLRRFCFGNFLSFMVKENKISDARRSAELQKLIDNMENQMEKWKPTIHYLKSEASVLLSDLFIVLSSASK